MTSDHETVDGLVLQIEQMGYSAALSHSTVGPIVGKVRAMESMLFEIRNDYITVLNDNSRLREELLALREERDEARREVCEFERVNMKQAHEYATYRDWDCYKEETQ